MTNVANFVSAGDGAAIPAGAVGEIKEATKTTNTTGSTTRANYTTIVTLSSLPAGVWRLDGMIGSYYITGAANDTGSAAAGALFVIRIYNSTDASTVIATGPAMAKSTVNSGYLTGGAITQPVILTITSPKTYTLDFAFESNSGANTETITGIVAQASSTNPVVLRAIRLA